MDIRQLAAGQRDYILHTRRHLHSHPELSWQEVATTAFITRELTALGIPVMPIPGSTGLVGVLRGEAPVQRGRTLMLRADIDALPIQERTGLPYASENPGVMHACGHDTHTAMLLGAARILHSLRAELAGEVRFLFQPAEEVNAGAEHCIRQGVLDGVDAIFGMHIWGDLDAPYFSIEQGSRMASCDNFTLTVHGTAAHGSAPHQGVDAIVAAAAVVTAAQTIVSRAVDPHVPLVLTFGEIHGGKRFNIIADEVTLVGTVRTHDRAVRRQVEPLLRRAAEHAAAVHGASITLDYQYLAPAVQNVTPALTALARDAATRLYGADALREMPPLMSSEDFAQYMERIPALFCFIGARNAALGLTAANHNDTFTVDEAALERGAALYAQFAHDYLQADELPRSSGAGQGA